MREKGLCALMVLLLLLSLDCISFSFTHKPLKMCECKIFFPSTVSRRKKWKGARAHANEWNKYKGKKSGVTACVCVWHSERERNQKKNVPRTLSQTSREHGYVMTLSASSYYCCCHRRSVAAVIIITACLQFNRMKHVEKKKNHWIMLFWTATAAPTPTSAHLHIYMAGKKLNRLYFFIEFDIIFFLLSRAFACVCEYFFQMYVQYTTNQIELIVLSVSMPILINMNVRSCICVCLQPFFSSSNSRSHLLSHAHTDKKNTEKKQLIEH